MTCSNKFASACGVPFHASCTGKIISSHSGAIPCPENHRKHDQLSEHDQLSKHNVGQKSSYTVHDLSSVTPFVLYSSVGLYGGVSNQYMIAERVKIKKKSSNDKT
jgi:hypothetical protein